MCHTIISRTVPQHKKTKYEKEATDTTPEQHKTVENTTHSKNTDNNNVTKKIMGSQSVLITLQVIEHFLSGRLTLKQKEIETTATSQTVWRVFKTLEADGWIRKRDGGKKWWPGEKLEGVEPK